MKKSTKTHELTVTRKITKEEAQNALDDILAIFDFDDIDRVQGDVSAKAILDYIEEKQESEDAFVDEDFTGQEDEALHAETVEILISAGITVPKTWRKRLKDCGYTLSEKKKKDEYSQILEDARDEKVSEEVLASVEDEGQDEIEKPGLESPAKSKKFSKKAIEEDKNVENEDDAPVKKPSKKKDKKAESEKPLSRREQRKRLYMQMFEAGTPRQEVLDKIMELDPDAKKSHILIEVSMFKSSKYNRLPWLVVEEDGVMKFDK